MRSTVKSVSNQKERADFGKKRIPRQILDGKTREEHTKLWGDDCLKGTLYCLHKSDKDNPLTYKDISKYIGWEWRTIKNKMNGILKVSILRGVIKDREKYSFSGRRHGLIKCWWFDEDDSISKWTFDELVSAITGSFYKSNTGEPNKCEKALWDIALKIQPGLWKFNGEIIPENKIDGLTPDLINKKHKLIIEHFGVRFHDPDQGEEEDRIKRLGAKGYKALIIWENELKDMNKCEKKIREFIENAIQGRLHIA